MDSLCCLLQAKFQGARGTLLGAADARIFSVGIEDVRYEGPLRLQIPIPLQVSRTEKQGKSRRKRKERISATPAITNSFGQAAAECA